MKPVEIANAEKFLNDGDGLSAVRVISGNDAEWVANASATALVATATKAGVALQSNTIFLVSASYSAAQIGTLTIRDGATVIAVYNVHNQRDVPLTFVAAKNSSVSAELSAGAAGVVGNVQINGRTR